MNDVPPAPDPDSLLDGEQPYRLHAAASMVQPVPVLHTSAHSGRHYPSTLTSMARLTPATLRRSEDAYVDQLIAAAPALGMAVLEARVARAFVDINRDPAELDPLLFHDAPPLHHRRTSDRVNAGLGVIPRIVGLGLDIYAHKISYPDAIARLAAVHYPFHAMLKAQLDRLVRAEGHALLIDWHSMPSGAVADRGRHAPQIVLGDCHGRACAPAITALMREMFEAGGYRVSINDPYAGGYITERYGRPMEGVHVLQVEISRQLYLDELKGELTSGFAPLQRSITAILEQLGAAVRQLDLPVSPATPWQLAAE